MYGRGLKVSSAGTKKLRSGADKRRRLRGREGDNGNEDVDAEKEAETARGGRASGMTKANDRGVSGEL